MKTQIRILVAIAMIASAACSKKKEEVVPVPIPEPTGGYASLEDFEQEVKLVPQTFQLNNVSGGVITGSEGTQLTFPANAFLHQNGTAVSGNATIELYEANKKSEMVLGGIFTATATVPLISGGQFKFVAIQNGEQLKFAPGKYATIIIPSANPDNNMVAYTQDVSTSDFSYTLGNDSSSWLYSDGTQYVGITDSMYWVNCDQPFVQADYKIISVAAPAGFVQNNSKVIFVFKNINTVIKVYWDISSSSHQYLYAPEGYEMTIVAIGVKDRKLYSSFTSHTITSAQTVNVSMNETTTANIKTQLDALN